MEDMKEILAALTSAVNLTNSGSNIRSIHPETVEKNGYYKDIAVITYRDGYVKEVSIECDSGIAAIYDIVRYLCH